MSDMGFHQLRALLEWQVELGATEAIGEHPVNRYEVLDVAPKVVAPATAAPAPDAPPPVAGADPVDAARAAAAAATDLEGLRAAIDAYEHCELKKGARNLVFADGDPAARVMIIGEAPGRDEDLQGLPFVGRAGQFLDRMLAAIGMARDASGKGKSVYITNVLPWRPPQNREPKPDEIAMMMPFVARHVELVDPDVLVLMGNVSCLRLARAQGDHPAARHLDRGAGASGAADVAPGLSVAQPPCQARGLGTIC